MRKYSSLQWFIIAITLLVLPCPLAAQHSGFARIEQSQPPSQLSRHIEYYATTDMLALQAIIRNQTFEWHSMPEGILNRGFTSETYWLRLRFIVTEPHAKEWMLSIENSFIDQLDVYLLNDGFPQKIVRTAPNKGFDQRAIAHPHFLYPLALKTGHHYELYMRVQSKNTLQLPIGLWQRDEFIERDSKANIGIGMSIGASILLALTALAFALFLRDRALLYYAGFILSLTLFNAAYYGLGYRGLWPSWPGFNSYSVYWFLVLAEIFIIAFTKELFKSPQMRHRYTDKLRWALMGTFLMPAALILLPTHLAFPCVLLLALAFNLVGLGYGLSVIMRRNTAAISYTLAMGTFALVIISFTLNQLGKISLTSDTNHLLTVGTICSAFMFLIAVTEQFREQRRARFQAQEKMLSYEVEMRIAKDNALQAVQAAKQTLEGKVQERTQTLEQTLQELQWAKAEVEEASAQKSRFLAAASHDIRQPLHALSLLVESVEADPASVEREIGKIRESVASLTELFNNLFDISKLENGLIKPNLVPVDINHLMHIVEGQMTVLAEQRNMQLKVETSDFWCLSDRVLLQRVFTILVDNAIKHSQATQLDISCTPLNNTLRLRIRDNGQGVPEEEQEKIFEAFYQLKNPERSKRKGMGLGLALCRRIIEALGHELRFESVLNEGCLFEISMPLIPSQQAAVDDRPPSAQPLALDALTVLVIDDEETILASTERLLTKWGVDCHCALNLDEAKTQLASVEHLDLIISDYRLPGDLNGFELIELLRNHMPYAVSALVITGDLNVASPDPSIKVIRKPIKPGKLRALLNGVAMKKRDEEEWSE